MSQNRTSPKEVKALLRRVVAALDVVGPAGELDREALDALRDEADATANAIAKTKPNISELSAIVDAIHAELDGKEWDADTCENIATLLTNAGYTIREPQ